MLAAAIIVFREVIEAGLIVGIVLAATKGVQSRTAYVVYGIAAGVLGASLLAAFAGTLANAFEGSGQDLFNACVLGLAVLMLGWHNIWMSKHGRELAAELSAAGREVAAGRKTLTALAIVVAVAVLREGAEVVLFLYGIVIANKESSWALLAGGVLGLALGVLTSALTYAGLLKIPARYLFSVTTLLITFLAAGMASQCVAYLDRADVLTLWSDRLWDTSWLLSSDTLAGRVLHTLVGYDDRPTVMQAVAYVITLVTILVAMRLFKPKPKLSGSANKPPVTA